MEAASFGSLSPHVPIFPRICTVGRLPLAVKRLSPLGAPASRIRIVHLQKHPSLGMEKSRCLVCRISEALLTSTVLLSPGTQCAEPGTNGSKLDSGSSSLVLLRPESTRLSMTHLRCIALLRRHLFICYRLIAW